MCPKKLISSVRDASLVTLMALGLSISPLVLAEEFTNFMGMKFVTIPAGSFQMGSVPSDGEATYDEFPQHEVRVSSFQMMTTEATLAQYKRYIIESSRVDILTDEFMNANKHGDDAPVVSVSWNGARKFLHWLNQHKPASDRGTYRLPTEAEWEYACHAGKQEHYCGSDKANTVAWYRSTTVTHQQEVAQKNANAFGLYDMSGNVREWVQDCYHENYESAPSDANVWRENCVSFNSYVSRGGSWGEDAQESRASDRLSVNITSQSPKIGFRVVRELR